MVVVVVVLVVVVVDVMMSTSLLLLLLLLLVGILGIVVAVVVGFHDIKMCGIWAADLVQATPASTAVRRWTYPV